jgi:hypothetical protein
MYISNRCRQQLSKIIPASEWGLVAYLVLFLICYSPVLIIHYAFSDDYYYLASACRKPEFPLCEWPSVLVAGRPLYIGLLYWCYSLCVHNIANFAVLRLQGILLLVLLAFCIYKAMSACGWNRTIAFGTAAIICTMPSFQVYIAWATVSPTILLTILAGASAYLSGKAFNGTRMLSRCMFWLIAVITLSGVLAVYQPPAMVFWLFVAIALFGPGSIQPECLKRFCCYLSVFGSACAIDFAVAQVGKSIYGPLWIDAGRTYLTHHIMRKIAWFIQEPVTNSLNFVCLFPGHITGYITAFLAGVAILVGLAFYLKGKPIDRLIQFIIALCLIPLAYLPNLLVAESWATYRTTIALSSLFVLYAIFALEGFHKKIFGEKYYPVLAKTIVALSVISSCVAFHNVFAYFAFPQALELSLLRVMNSINCPVSALLEYKKELAPGVRYDEFGCSSVKKDYLRNPVLYVVQKFKK